MNVLVLGALLFSVVLVQASYDEAEVNLLLTVLEKLAKKSNADEKLDEPLEQRRVVEKASSDLINEALSAHNTLRAAHQNTPPMTWDNEVAARAQKWADHLGDTGTFAHSSAPSEYRKDSGENIYWWSDTSATVAQGIVAFYSEEWESQYNYESGTGNGGMIGHFTQVVWDDSVRLGCGVSRKQGFHLVCQYAPPGNWYGEYPQHVHRPKSGINPKTVADSLLN